MKSIWCVDYMYISEIKLSDKLTDVLELCSDGINILRVDTPVKYNYDYTILLSKGDKIELWGFREIHMYAFKEEIFFNEESLIADLITEIYNIIMSSNKIIIYK